MRLVVAAWCLTGIVFANSYSSSLVSYLTAPRFVQLMNTAQDLAESNQIRLLLRKFTFQYSVLMVSIARYQIGSEV